MGVEIPRHQPRIGKPSGQRQPRPVQPRTRRQVRHRAAGIGQQRVGRHAGRIRRRGQIGRAIAHQPLDRRAAGAVVGGEGMAARGGQPPRIDRGLPVGRAGGVLRIALRQARDRGRPEAQKRHRLVVGIALEIAAQPPFGGGPRQPVAGAREMVDADGHIAAIGQHLARRGGQRDARPRARQRVFGDHALAPRHPGHMRIAVKRDAVGKQGQHLAQGRGQPCHRLVRQAIDQIHAQAADAAGAQPLGGGTGGRRALRAADGGLHLGVEILHPDGGAVDPQRGQRVQPLRVDLRGVGLDRDLGVRAGGERGGDRIAQPRGLRRRQQRRRAAAEMHPRHARRAGDQRAHPRKLGHQTVEIAVQRHGAGRALGAAGAEPAQPPAERDVQIKRQGRTLGQRAQPVGVGLGPDRGSEGRGRWIAGIARRARI